MKRRVIFCTYPSVYSDAVLAELLHSKKIELVGVVLSDRVLRKEYSHFYASLCQIRLSGFAYAIYLFVITDLYPFLLKMFGKSGAMQFLKKYDIPVLKTKNINDAEGVGFVAGLQADVMLSAHFNQLVGKTLLHSEGMSCLNIHPSLLPAYKGVDPAFHALLQGESSTGVTVHFQDVEFDTGRILEQVEVGVLTEDSLLGLNLRLFRQGVFAAIRQIQDSSDGRQQHGKGNYDSWPNARQVKVLRRYRKLFRLRELFSATF